MVKIKKEDFESLAGENGIHNLEKFYQSDYFNSNFIFNSEILNGKESRFICKEI